MYDPTPKVLMIWIGGDATASPTPQARRVLEQSHALARLGYDVELWTRQCAGDLPGAESLPEGLRVRRFPCGDCGSVREPSPCEYVAEFVAAASEALADVPPAGVTLVSHSWDAGLATRLLAARFAIAHVHVPHELAAGEATPLPDSAPAARDHARRLREERETCRAASRVIASTPAQRDVLLGHTYDVPAHRVIVAPLPIREPFGLPGFRAYDRRPLGVESRLDQARAALEDAVL